MNESSPQLLLHRVLDRGEVDAASGEWLLAGIRRWMAPGASLTLTACLGLPGKPGAVRAAMRDRWLAEAALELAGGPWELARELRRCARRYEAGAWRYWRNSPLPAPEASRVEVAIHFALRSGAPLPGSVQQYRNILATQTKTARDLGDVGSSSFPDQR